MQTREKKFIILDIAPPLPPPSLPFELLLLTAGVRRTLPLGPWMPWGQLDDNPNWWVVVIVMQPGMVSGPIDWCGPVLLHSITSLVLFPT